MKLTLHFLKPFVTFIGIWVLCIQLTACGGGTTTNVAPTANPGPSQNVVVGAVVSMDGSASKDSDGGSLTFKWTLIGKPNGSAASLINPTYPNPKFTADLAGNYVVSLVVNDGKADSSVASVSVTATVANAVPVANAGVNQNVVIGSTVTLDGTTSSDANNDSLSYKWVLQSKPANSVATLTAATSAKPTFKADLSGTYVATLVVSDGKASSELAAVSILAGTANLPPVAKPGANQSVVVGSKVSIDASASSDPNGDSISYSWSLLFKPVGSNATLSWVGVNASFTADLVGTYLVGLTVNDGKLDSPVVVLTVTAERLNLAPVANAGVAQSVLTAAVVTLNGTGSTDANSDTLTYRWTLTSKPASSTATLSSATVASPTFTADLAGSYVASLVVNDGKVDSSNTSTVTVTAAAANVAPVANAGSVQTVSRSGGTITVTLNATGSTDANGDTLTYRWAVAYQPPTSSITLSSTTAASPTFAATVAGVYVFTLVVNDGKIDSAAATVSITVN